MWRYWPACLGDWKDNKECTRHYVVLVVSIAHGMEAQIVAATKNTKIIINIASFFVQPACAVVVAAAMRASLLGHPKITKSQPRQVHISARRPRFARRLSLFFLFNLD